MLVCCKCNKDRISNRILGINIGELYKVISIDAFGYKICDNLGRNFWYSKECFHTQEELRQIQLNKII